MFELLSTNPGWPVRSLSSGLRINKESRLAIENLEEYRILGVTNRGGGVAIKRVVVGTELTMREYQRTLANQLMWCKVDTKNGAFGITKEEHVGSLASLNMCLADIDVEVFDPSFLQFFFQLPAVIDGITSASLGTTNRQYLKPREFLDSVRLRLPPLPEQRRIVARIEELAANINKARGLRQEAAEEAKILLNAAMKTRFDCLGARTTVADYAEVQGGYAFPSSEYDEFGTHQVLRIGNVRDGFLDLSRAPVRWTTGKDSRVLKYELNTGDLVISMTGTRNKRDYGFVAKVPPGGKLLLNQRVGRLVVHREIDRDYLFYFLRSPFFRDNLFPSATGTANQANVGNADIESVPFAAPEDVSEQRSIVAQLDALQKNVDALKKLQAETAAEFDALLPSILNKAFKGEL